MIVHVSVGCVLEEHNLFIRSLYVFKGDNQIPATAVDWLPPFMLSPPGCSAI